jgi:hypothetical protein
VIAGHDLAAELRIRHAPQRAPGQGRHVPALQQQHGRDLGQRLDHQHGRHERLTGKVPLEEILVDADVLDRDEPATRLVLRDRVDQERGIAKADAIEKGGEIYGHAVSVVLGSRFSVLGSCSRSGFGSGFGFGFKFRFRFRFGSLFSELPPENKNAEAER